jgi:anaerobic ribonucleoside-triphosphate reductase activating protein
MTNELVLNVVAFVKDVETVGPGVRDVIWVQGCSIRCPGCFNQALLPHVPRRLIPVARFLEHFRHRRRAIDGISVTGGEPTEQAQAVAALLEGVKELGFSTVVYTGRLYEDILEDRNPAIARLLAVTDLLIDGPFVLAERDINLHWRGSRNQRLLYLTPRLAECTPEEAKPNGEILLDSQHIILNGIGTSHLAKWLHRQNKV